MNFLGSSLSNLLPEIQGHDPVADVHNETQVVIDHDNGQAEVFAQLYRDVLSAQRHALITELDEGRIDDEAVRAMLERLDLQEAGVSARLESRF